MNFLYKDTNMTYTNFSTNLVLLLIQKQENVMYISIEKQFNNIFLKNIT